MEGFRKNIRGEARKVLLDVYDIHAKLENQSDSETQVDVRKRRIESLIGKDTSSLAFMASPDSQVRKKKGM